MSSNPSETGGRPLASSIPQPEGTEPSSTAPRRRRRTSQSSDERIGGTKSTSSRRRPGTRKETTFLPHTGSSRGDSSTMQRSTSPTHMSPDAAVHYTRTGRISKAKKGLKVHNCECGRSYTRAEHLRRHQKNHAQDALRCDFPGCGRPFFRLDLLQRHQERHNEGGPDSPQQSVYSPASTAEPETRVTAAVALPAPIATAHPPPSPYYQPAASPMLESATDARYTSNPFRTPRKPSSMFPILRSSPTSKSPANLNHLKQRADFSARQNSVAIPVPTEGLQTNIAWNDPFNHSPSNYHSSSSGYASPIPGTGDYANVFANPPYGAYSNRTRTSSNASFIEPWTYPSRSPTSATSTLAYTWTSHDKSPAQASLAYMTTSYPMTSMPMAAGVDPMTGFGHFGPKTMAQRDEEEQQILFPFSEQSYGMGQNAHTYPFEQYLDNYWRHFHPAFPVVHRTTFESMSQSPMLHAAMVAIGGQYSNDAAVKRKSRILHDRCIKLLEKRDLDVMTESDRLCDSQAIFLIEVLSQYRARRASKSLSTRFETMYHRFCEKFRIITSNIVDHIAALAQPENATYERWAQWVELCTRQRLLLCCYILEHQQATLLARQPQQSLIQFSGFDLPFPAHSSLWDAASPTDWALAAQQTAHLPEYVYQITTDMAPFVVDSFQSSLLIATHYNHFNNPAPYLSPPSFVPIDHLLDSSPITKHQLLSAKLLQVTPIRALLAVSGESWILSEKVPSPQAFTGYKTTLRSWISGLWSGNTDSHNQPVRDALKLAIEILQHAMTAPPHTLRLELGADMGLYFAALVIWSATVAANTRINIPHGQAHQHRFQSHSPLPTTRAFPSTPTHLAVNTPTTSPSHTYPPSVNFVSNQAASPAPYSPTSSSMQYSDIATQSAKFLSTALVDLEFLGIVHQWPRDISQWQQGCGAMMRWVKVRMRSGAAEGRDSVVASGYGVGPTSAGTGRGSDGFGELLDSVIGVLEKIMGKGWEGWGI
ncbi:hypothetical protein K458DRAFT_390311 [Lentithecium fluviatile CBS 122367]|uniref:C2H2-type domain-containing protein n=1 Tax=Lentithecium fluviatile CBS 122367 TaxID=1168545 RepID=A0A6G1IYI8_9PLEO|nr:hypothetical protein K458DRAFT_390311 [Lentithecium fluviatile CBS 122367]